MNIVELNKKEIGVVYGGGIKNYLPSGETVIVFLCGAFAMYCIGILCTIIVSNRLKHHFSCRSPRIK